MVVRLEASQHMTWGSQRATVLGCMVGWWRSSVLSVYRRLGVLRVRLVLGWLDRVLQQSFLNSGVSFLYFYSLGYGWNFDRPVVP